MAAARKPAASGTGTRRTIPSDKVLSELSDREVLEAFLERCRLDPAVPPERTWPVFDDGEEYFVVLAAKTGNVQGFKGFYSTFEFDDDGTFKSLGLWE